MDKTVKSIESQLKVHSEALGLRSRRNEILSSNIANAGTPNFKAKDLDFNEISYLISISKKSNVLSILPNCKSSHNFEGVSPPAYLSE